MDQYGSDELLLPSLQASDEIDMPGRFDYNCSRKGDAGNISRICLWVKNDDDTCLSRRVRHSICILGVEHLSLLAETPHIMANKVEFGFI
ncbi:unnamed protein product [Strongylus vulgaris]|uniref:Uncharacterized protein n=1 Tax=Strongylus vulgaris TaxID=40348 RepID=A0A3P7J8S4_STRVU|nr:unnamed protein product [Strongylus vulgaris]